MRTLSLTVLAAVMVTLYGGDDGHQALELITPHWEELGAHVNRNDAGHLTVLVVTGPKVEDKDLRHLRDVSALQVLILEDVEPRDDGWHLTDAALATVDSARKLLFLQLSGRGFTDRALPKIGRLTNLPSLNLSHTSITDEGLKHLGRLSLKSLTLVGAKISGKGLSYLRDSKRLQNLYLDDATIVDEALEHVAQFQSLSSLSLKNTRITDEGLKKLSALVSLERLELDNTAITAAGVQHLENMKNLSYLSLQGTKVTDAAIPSLAKLTGLQALDLFDTAVTKPGTETLFQLFPNAGIYWEDPEDDFDK